jgi:DNA adenine methylase
MIQTLPAQRGLKGSNHEQTVPQPFIKWAGGKRKLAPFLIDAFPADFNPQKNSYFEPFLGGGALAFKLGNPTAEYFLQGDKLILNDMNPELVATYEVIRDNVSGLIRVLSQLQEKINEKTFYEIRASQPRSKVARAARFIYLNKTCFNGLWRVNSKGEFNVPFGKSKNPSLFSEENLRACSKRLKGSTITNISFEKSVKKAKKGDLVYFDPPYIPLTPSASFSAYAKEGFGKLEHELLAKTILDLTKRGVYVLLSNSDTELTRKIFQENLILRRLLMARSISSSGSTRKPVFEIIGMNYTNPRGAILGQLELISKPKKG